MRPQTMLTLTQADAQAPVEGSRALLWRAVALCKQETSPRTPSHLSMCLRVISEVLLL